MALLLWIGLVGVGRWQDAAVGERDVLPTSRGHRPYAFLVAMLVMLALLLTQPRVAVSCEAHAR